jgi:cell division protein FtsB
MVSDSPELSETNAPAVASLTHEQDNGTLEQDNDTPSQSTSRRRSSRHSKSRRYHNHHHQRSGLFWLAVGCAILLNFFILLFFGLQVYRLSRENTVLKINLTQHERELEQARPELEKLRQDIADLNQGRLPGLRKMEYDQVISLNDGYLKNINFTEISDKDTKGYEYKLVLQNDTLSTLWPKLKVHFFNARGIQINRVHMTVEKKEGAVQVDTLGPGETRSYSATIKVPVAEEKPAYFMVERQDDGTQRITNPLDADLK